MGPKYEISWQRVSMLQACGFMAVHRITYGDIENMCTCSYMLLHMLRLNQSYSMACLESVREA